MTRHRARPARRTAARAVVVLVLAALAGLLRPFPAMAGFSTRIPSFGDPELLPALTRLGVRVQVAAPPSDGWASALRFMIPWLLLVLLFALLSRRLSPTLGGGVGPGGELKRFLDAATREAPVPTARFSDIAGQANAKREVQELIDYLRDRPVREVRGAGAARRPADGPAGDGRRAASTGTSPSISPTAATGRRSSRSTSARFPSPRTSIWGRSPP